MDLFLSNSLLERNSCYILKIKCSENFYFFFLSLLGSAFCNKTCACVFYLVESSIVSLWYIVSHRRNTVF